MKVSTYLKPIKRSKSDTPSAYLGFRVRDRQVDIKVQSDVVVNPDLWNNETSSYKRTRLVPKDEQKRMQDFVSAVTSLAVDSFDEKADSAWLKGVVETCLNHEGKDDNREKKKLSLVEWFEQFLTDHFTSKGSIINARATYKKLQRFQQYKREVEGVTDYTLFVESITSEEIMEFRSYFINEHTHYKEHRDFYAQFDIDSHPPKELSNTTIVNTMNMLRIFLKWCISKGFSENYSYRKITFPNAVHGDPFFLTLEERDKIYDADLSDNPRLALVRDVFMFQSLTGCRVSDLYSFTYENISDNTLSYIPYKTKGKVTKTLHVPLNGKAQALLAKYPWDRNRKQPIFPFPPKQFYSRSIQPLLKAVGIDRIVHVYDTTTSETVAKHLYEVATTHTARKTFIANLYCKVADPELISSMTGHTDSSRSFRRYRTIDNDMRKNLMDLIK